MTLRGVGSGARVLNVTLHVQRQVVGTREAAIAVATLEGFGAGVFAVVARQLVRAGEAPAATLPLAFVGLLSWNRQHSRLPQSL